MIKPRMLSPLFLGIVALALALPSAAGAQGSTTAPATGEAQSGKPHAKHRAAIKKDALEDRLEQMTQRLKLTDEQKEKIKPILQTDMAQKQDLHAKYKGKPATTEDKEAMEKAHKELRADTDAKLAAVLSADQMKELQKMRAGHRGHMKKDEAREEKKEGEK